MLARFLHTSGCVQIGLACIHTYEYTRTAAPVTPVYVVVLYFLARADSVQQTADSGGVQCAADEAEAEQRFRTTLKTGNFRRTQNSPA